MAHEMFFNIADISIRITSPEKPSAEEKLSYRYENFVLKKRCAQPDIDLKLKVIPRFLRFDPKILFATERETGLIKEGMVGMRRRLRLKRRQKQRRIRMAMNAQKEEYLGKGIDWRLAELGDKFLLEGGTGGNFQVLLDKDLKNGEVFIIDDKGKWKITDIIYGFLQVLIIYYMAKYKLGIVTHSAGIRDKNSGYLFIGKSGAGKSTTARIWDMHAKVKVLNDDRVIIRKKGRRFFIYGTPWHGDFSDYLKTSLEKAALNKMFFIYHRGKNYAASLSLRDNFNLLFQSSFLPFWDKKSLEFISHFLLDAAMNIPCYHLGFKNNEKVISYVRQLE